ncbi:MAG: hypothetical protein PHS81_04240 [Candidatus Nanoarchaeia archaeon]|nr:hypothetical protein [Candidatus Nanoarchaeia archaeon]
MSGSNSETLTDIVNDEKDYSNYHSDLTPKEVFDQSMKDLGYTSEDFLYITATYMNQNIKRICKWNGELLDLSQYAGPNFDQKQWDEHMLKMKELGLEKKLEFQIALYAITSEPLMRKYFYNMNNGEGKTRLVKNMNNPEIFTHADLAVAYADELNNYIYTPSLSNGGFRIKDLDVGDYLNELDRKIRNGASAETIIEDLLENFSKYFFLEKDDYK